MNISRKSESSKKFYCPKGLEKEELVFQEAYHSRTFRYETLNSNL